MLRTRALGRLHLAQRVHLENAVTAMAWKLITADDRRPCPPAIIFTARLNLTEQEQDQEDNEDQTNNHSPSSDYGPKSG